MIGCVLPNMGLAVTFLLLILPLASADQYAGQVLVHGAGAGFAQPVYERWFSLWSLSRPVAVTYKGVGSYYGLQWMKGEAMNDEGSIGEQIVFAGLDSDLSEEDYEKYPELQLFPIVAGGLVVGFNIPGITGVRLNRVTLTGIYMGNIKKWNDPRVQEMNLHVQLPNKKIVVIARRDIAGVTSTFTKGLSQFNDEWKETYGEFNSPELERIEGPSGTWPPNSTTVYAHTDIGMSAAILSLPYSVGYLSVAEAIQWKIPIATIQNKFGEMISPEKIAHGVDIASEFRTDAVTQRMTVDLVDVPSSGAYSLAALNYVIVNMSTSPGNTCEQMKYFVQLMRWCLKDKKAKEIAAELNMVALLPNMVRKIENRVLNRIRCKGRLVYDLIAEEQIAKGLSLYQICMITAFGVLLLVGMIVGIYHYNMRLGVSSKNWLLPDNEVVMSRTMPILLSHASKYMASKIQSAEDSESDTGSDNQDRTTLASEKNIEGIIAPYWGIRVGHTQGKNIILFETKCARPPSSYKYDTAKRIYFMTRQLTHECVQPFLGLMKDKDNHVFHIFKAVSKGSMHNILKCCPYDLNEDIKYTLSNSICNGMMHLHKFGIFHGYLDTWNILLDTNWTIKIANWAQPFIYEMEGDMVSLCMSKTEMGHVKNRVEIMRNVFRHPDCFTGEMGATINFQKKHDLFSFAMCMCEVFSRRVPHTERANNVGWEKVFEEFTVGRRMPSIPPEVPTSIRNLIEQLLKDSLQINFEAISTVLQISRINKKGHGIVDTLMKAMEEYMMALESKVAERTQEMRDTMARMDNLLAQILPKEIAKKLQNKEKIEPKFYDSVSLYFSDIVQFTKLSSSSTPLEIVNFLNALYTLFDRVVEQFDCYKVETIGDAYMVGSGFPKTNGELHAAEITRMAIKLLKGVKCFKIPHRRNHQLELRIGLHSGSVMAGVVGLKMPRYCLFGDSVKTAEYMESSGKANMIQASETTVNILNSDFKDEFDIEFRGECDRELEKGKGHMKTYWINDNFTEDDAKTFISEEEASIAATGSTTWLLSGTKGSRQNLGSRTQGTKSVSAMKSGGQSQSGRSVTASSGAC